MSRWDEEAAVTVEEVKEQEKPVAPAAQAQAPKPPTWLQAEVASGVYGDPAKYGYAPNAQEKPKSWAQVAAGKR